MLINDTNEMMGFGDNELGWGWKSIGSAFKKAAKATYKVASIPVSLANKVATATSKVLCSGGGVKGDSKDARTAQAFCKAVKIRDTVTSRRLLTQATQIAAQKARASKIAAVAKTAAYYLPPPPPPAPPPTPPADDDTSYPIDGVFLGAELGDNEANLLAPLAGADPEALSFALSQVQPGEIGAIMTGADIALFAPVTIAVLAGLWMLTKG